MMLRFLIALLLGLAVGVAFGFRGDILFVMVVSLVVGDWVGHASFRKRRASLE